MIQLIELRHDLVFSLSGENLCRFILPKTSGDHLYYILNLESGVVKFGISKDVRKRMISHVNSFLGYGKSPAENLFIKCSQFSVPDARELEQLLLKKVGGNHLFSPLTGNEFFVYNSGDTTALDTLFNSFVEDHFNSGGENFEPLKLKSKTSLGAKGSIQGALSNKKS